MIKDHSDSERGNLLPPLHGLLFLISFSTTELHLAPKQINLKANEIQADAHNAG